jgi:hypothetical protein
MDILFAAACDKELQAPCISSALFRQSRRSQPSTQSVIEEAVEDNFEVS